MHPAVRTLLAVLCLTGTSLVRAQKWIDTKTGEPVASGPIITDPKTGKTEYVLPSIGDPDYAYDDRTQRNFYFDHKDCRWKDTKTLKPVASGPIITDPKTGNTEYILPSIGDRDSAYDDRTQRNFARNCPPPLQQARTTLPSQATPKSARPTEMGAAGRASHLNYEGVRVELSCRGDPPPAGKGEGRTFERVEGDFSKERAPKAGGATGRPCEPPSPPPAPTGSVGLGVPPRGALLNVLVVHNRVRAEVGSPPLQWDSALAATASTYARQLASGLPYVHAARTGRETERENLSMGRLRSTPVQLMQLWLNEKQNFIPGIFPNVSKTGDWYKVGHYSQMVWATTTHVGCGTATGAKWKYMVCRYSPPGNTDGKPVLARQNAGATNYGWIDTKTLKPVTSYPVLPGPGEHPIGTGTFHYVIPNPGGKSAYDPDTQRNFAKDECGNWIDTKTGKGVLSYPVLPGPGEHPIGTGTYHYIIPNPGGKSAYDPDTGRNFAREPCPPK